MSTFNRIADKTRKIEEKGVMLSLAPITPHKEVYQTRKSNSAEVPQDSASLVDDYDGVLTQELIMDSAAAGLVSKRVLDVDLGLMKFDVGVDTSLKTTGSVDIVDINVGPDSTFSLESSLNSGLHEAALPHKQEYSEEFAEAVARVSAKRVLSWGDTPGSDSNRPDVVELKASPTPISTEKLSSSDFNPLTPSAKRKRSNGLVPKRKKLRPKIYDELKPKKLPKEKPMKKPRVASQKPRPPKSAKGKNNRESSAGVDEQMADHATEEVSQVTNGEDMGSLKIERGDTGSQRNMKKSRIQSNSDIRALELLLGGALGASLTKKWGNYGTRSRGQFCWKPRMGCNYNSFCGYQRSWNVNSCLNSIRRVGFKVPKGMRSKRKKRMDVLPKPKASEPTYQQEAHANKVAAKVQQTQLKGRKVKAQPADGKGKLKSKATKGILRRTVLLPDKNKVEQEHEGVALRAKELNFLVSRFKKLSFNLKKGKSKKKVTEKGAIVPYKYPLKVFLDDISMKMWNQLMNIERPEEMNDDEREKWGKERKIFGNLIDGFTKIMRHLLGDRRFKPWKGSVVDSIVGVYLTQNVSDHLSSSAYLSLSAKFPLKKLPEDEEDEEIVNSQESVGSNMEYDLKGNRYYVMEPKESQIHESEVVSGEVVKDNMEYDLKGNRYYVMEPKESQIHESEVVSSEVVKDPPSNSESSENTPSSQESDKDLHLDELEKQFQGNEPMSQNSQSYERSEPPPSELLSQESDQSNRRSEPSKNEVVRSIKNSGGSPDNSSATTPNPKGKKKVMVEPRDWDELRKLYSRSIPKSEMDSVDWEKVRHAELETIANAIQIRGQHFILGRRIKAFLNRTVSMHGSIDLEWLRHAPPEDVKQYLLEIPGVGLKSVECVRLLSLRHAAFPVDTNVGRIAVRLGWVPLEPLPGSLQFHLLQEYPPMDAIQKYLWPRLCGHDQPTLYELHYQMITFGKVFCTKKNPNCGPCPLKETCLYYASKDRASPALPAAPHKNEKGEVRPEIAIILDKNDATTLYNKNLQVRSTTSLNCEPIIEEPSSPVHEQDIEDFFLEDTYCDDDPIIEEPSSPVHEQDIEDFLMEDTYCDEEGEITIFNLSSGSLDEETGTCSRELVPSQLENSRSAPKLKNEQRLRTEYQVYELPAEHELLRNFNKIEYGSCPYLLVVWPPGEVPSSSKVPQKTEVCNDGGCSNSECTSEENDETVLGTVMIPCRTATRQRFPLNGTYFQVNEVFADRESSYHPIKVRRAAIWNLPKQTLYFGSSASSIYKGLQTEKIRESFSYGYVCVRAFDRKTGYPEHLSQRFHIKQSERKATGKGTKSK